MADPITFTVADIPADAAPSDPVTDAPASSDRACEVCGTALSYSGRGRPPTRCDDHKKSSSNGASSPRANSGRKSTRDVEAAMAALDAAHTSLSFGLMLMSPSAAVAWEESRTNLNARNQMILESDPALAKRIASMAAKGGGTALILNHLIAIVPVLGIVRGDMRERASVKRAARQEAEAVDMPLDFDAAMAG